MKTVQKLAVSLLAAIVLFAGFAVLAFSGLFDVIESRFYNRRITEVIENDVVIARDSIDVYHRLNSDRFIEILQNPSIKLVHLPNLSSEIVEETSTLVSPDNLFDDLKESLPGFLFTRIVDERGEIFFSTTGEDISKRTDQTITYRSLDEVEPDIALESLQLQEGDPPRIYLDGTGNRIIYQHPYYDNVNLFKGTALFYVSSKDLRNTLLKKGILEEGTFITLLDNAGYLFNVDLTMDEATKSELIDAISERSATDRDSDEVFNEPVVTSGEGRRYFLFSTATETAGVVAFLVDEQEFSLGNPLKYILLAVFFLTTFLVVFLILNFKQDRLVVLSERVKKFQIDFIKGYIEKRDEIDWEEWKLDLGRKREQIKRDIKSGLGALDKRGENQVDTLIDRSWDEIISVIGERAEGDARQTLKLPDNLDLSNLEKMFEKVLSSGKIVLPADQIQIAGPVSVPQPVSVESVEDLKKTSEMEAVEVEDLEEVEEIEEVEGVEEAEGVEEVEELEELVEAEAAEPVEALEEGEAPSSAGAAEEAEPGAAPETAEPAEVLEKAEEIEEAPAVKEPAPAVPGEESEEGVQLFETEFLEEVYEEPEEEEELEELPVFAIADLSKEKAVETAEYDFLEIVEDTSRDAELEYASAVGDGGYSLFGGSNSMPLVAPEEWRASEISGSAELLEIDETGGEVSIPEKPGFREAEAEEVAEAAAAAEAEVEEVAVEPVEALEEAEVSAEAEAPAEAEVPEVVEAEEAEVEELEEAEIEELEPTALEEAEELEEAEVEELEEAEIEELEPTALEEAEELEEAEVEELEEAEELEEPEEVEEAEVPALDFDEAVRRSVEAGEIEEHDLGYIMEIYRKFVAAIGFEDGVYRVKEEVIGTDVEPRDTELKGLVEEVVSSDQPETLYSGIDDLFTGTGVDLPFFEEEEPSAAPSTPEKKAVLTIFDEHGYNLDFVTAKFGGGFKGEMKAMKELSKSLKAIMTATLIKEEDVFSVESSLGLDNTSVSLLKYAADSDFAAYFLEPLKFVIFKRLEFPNHSLNVLISEADKGYVKSVFFLPVTIRQRHGHLFFGMKTTDCDSESIIKTLLSFL